VFPSRNAGAGESANTEDVWLSLMSCVKPDVHTVSHESPASSALTAGENSSEGYTDRKADYIKHSVDISSPDFTVGNSNAREASGTTHLELVDTSCRMMLTEAADQSFASPSAADHPFSNEHDLIKQSADMFSDFSAFSNTVTENTNMHMDETCSKKLGDGDDGSQHMQLFKPFPDADEFNQQYIDCEHVWMPISSTDQVFNQQNVESSDGSSLAKHEINASLPDVHTSATKQELISAFPDQLFSEEAKPDFVDLLKPTVDDAVAIEEIQVNSLNSFTTY